jgi:hypothetical protein
MKTGTRQRVRDPRANGEGDGRHADGDLGNQVHTMDNREWHNPAKWLEIEELLPESMRVNSHIDSFKPADIWYQAYKIAKKRRQNGIKGALINECMEDMRTLLAVLE